MEKVSFSDTKILLLFVITLLVDEKHYVLNRDKLMETVEIQLSQKIKTFCLFFFSLLKSILNFKHLPKKMTPIPDVFPEKLALKNMVR